MYESTVGSNPTFSARFFQFFVLIAGSCATKARKPRQVREEATVAGCFVCRRGAWLSFFLQLFSSAADALSADTSADDLGALAGAYHAIPAFPRGTAEQAVSCFVNLSGVEPESRQSVEKWAGAQQGRAAELRLLCKSQEICEVGRSVFGQPVVEKVRNGFFNGLLESDSASLCSATRRGRPSLLSAEHVLSRTGQKMAAPEL